jgi:hypothetical protein
MRVLKTQIQSLLLEMNQSLEEMIHVTAGQERNLSNATEMPKN